MCKICIECKGIMNYDPYFEAEVCVRCGNIERKKNKEIKRGVLQYAQSIELTKKIMRVMSYR